MTEEQDKNIEESNLEQERVIIKNYLKGLEDLFAALSDDEMQKYIEEEKKIQNIYDRQSQTTDLVIIEELQFEVNDIIDTSKFKEIRQRITMYDAALNIEDSDERELLIDGL